MRERLIQELNRLKSIRGPWIESVADFIIADRKRIVEPLINFKTKCKTYREDSWNTLTDSAQCIDKTLKNAGYMINDGKKV